MLARNESDVKELIGIRQPSAYFATMLTCTGTGANEAVLHALASLGRGLILRNGYFGDRAVAQAVQAGIDHVVMDSPHDRPLDPTDVTAVIDRNPGLTWLFFVSHETRVGLVNPFEELGRLGKEKGLMVGADVVSSAYAYPLDLEHSGIDFATGSSAKAIMAAPGLGIVFVKRDAIPALRAGGKARPRSYYLDLIAEFERQSSDFQTRFAQPVVLHAALRGACNHLMQVGIDNHMARIRRQMEVITQHLAAMDVHGILEPEYSSQIAVNFRLPASMTYSTFSSRMVEKGYFILYGIPGDGTHFQVSTIGDINDEDVEGLKQAMTQVLTTEQ